ncbi:hypothetical protein GS504_15870 [Rhodococcus hoagii]|nr:hypothetical protein [Prescottella equi]
MTATTRTPAPGHPELVEFCPGIWYALLWADETRRGPVHEASDMGTRSEAIEWLHDRDHLAADAVNTPLGG